MARPPIKCRHIIFDAETWCGYERGGFYPADIGHVVVGSNELSYRILHKLGYGGSSVTWLVREEPTQRNLALKILRADINDCSELRMFNHIRNLNGAFHPHLVTLYDSFVTESHNGTHQCLLLPVLGPSLRHFSGLRRALSGPTHQLLCEQVTSAIAYLHRNGICHGDLTSSNIVFEIPDVDTMSEERLLGVLGPFISEDQMKWRNQQGEIVAQPPRTPLTKVEKPSFKGFDWSSTKRLFIIDFGEAFFVNNPPRDLGIPMAFYPVDLYFGGRPSFHSDTWSLALVLYMIQRGFSPFTTVTSTIYGLIRVAINVLGPLPQAWKGRSVTTEEIDDRDESGRSREDKKAVEPEDWFTRPANYLFKDDLLGAEHLSEDQRVAYSRLLHQMLAYEPSSRISTEQVWKDLVDMRSLDG